MYHIYIYIRQEYIYRTIYVYIPILYIYRSELKLRSVRTNGYLWSVAIVLHWVLVSDKEASEGTYGRRIKRRTFSFCVDGGGGEDRVEYRGNRDSSMATGFPKASPFTAHDAMKRVIKTILLTQQTCFQQEYPRRRLRRVAILCWTWFIASETIMNMILDSVPPFMS